MNILIFLAAISACSAGVVPQVFYADEHVSEFETLNLGKVKGNCVNRIGWREWKLRGGLNSIPLCGTQQREINFSGTKKESQRQQSDQFKNSILNPEKFSKTRMLTEKVDELDNGNQSQEFRAKSQNQNLEIPASGEKEKFTKNLLDSSEATKLTNTEDLSVPDVNVVEKEYFQGNVENSFNKTSGLTEMFSKFEISCDELSGLDALCQNGSLRKILESDQSEQLEEISQESSEADLISPEDTFELLPTSNASNVLNTFNFSDSLNLQFVTENVSIESLSVDENILMSEGGEIALFQDDSTQGFEFLIDSETTKNLLVLELLESQGFVEIDDDETSLTEDVFVGSGTEIIKLDLVEDNEPNLIDNNETVSGKVSFNSTIGLDNLFITEEASKDGADGIVTENDGTDSENDVSTVRHSSVFTTTMECPRPGICVFWFLARDKCEDSSQCEGSSICCKIRCSKTCIDA